MRFKGTVWLTAVFICFGLYYFLVEIPSEQKEKQQQARSEKLLLFEPKEVEQVSFSSGKGPRVLKRASEGDWELVEPVKARGDSAALSAFLTRLKNARFIRVVDESPDDLSIYGLKDPFLSLTLKLKGGEEKTLLAGDEHPMKPLLYVRRKDENRVLLAEILRAELDQSVYDLRDKTILEFQTAEITRAEIRRGKKSLTLNKKDDGWEVSEKITAHGDPAEIENFLTSLRTARVRQFVEENPASLSSYDLDPPRIKLTLRKGKEEAPLSLLIGKEKDGGYYARTGKAENVFLVDRNLVETLSKGLADFMDKTLLDFKEEDVAQLHIKHGDESIVLVRDEEDPSRWNITTPVHTAADLSTLHSLLFDLKDTRIHEIVKTSIPKPEAFGLDHPKKELTLTFKKGKTWNLKLGNTTRDKQFHFAARSNESSVFSLREENVKKIFRSLHDLRDKKLLHFKKTDVRRVLLKYPDQTFELEKEGKNWNLLKPERIDKVKPFLGNDLLWTLKNLEYEVLSEPPAKVETTGFEKPSVTVSLWDPNNQNLGTVEIGQPVEGQTRYFARVEGNPALYQINKRFLDELPRNLEKFKH